jgi:hypothetical protein
MFAISLLAAVCSACLYVPAVRYRAWSASGPLGFRSSCSASSPWSCSRDCSGRQLDLNILQHAHPAPAPTGPLRGQGGPRPGPQTLRAPGTSKRPQFLFEPVPRFPSRIGRSLAKLPKCQPPRPKMLRKAKVGTSMCEGNPHARRGGPKSEQNGEHNGAENPFSDNPMQARRGPSRQLARFYAPRTVPWRAGSRYPRTVGDLAGAGERTAPLPPLVKKK